MHSRTTFIGLSRWLSLSPRPVSSTQRRIVSPCERAWGLLVVEFCSSLSTDLNSRVRIHGGPVKGGAERRGPGRRGVADRPAGCAGPGRAAGPALATTAPAGRSPGPAAHGDG